MDLEAIRATLIQVSKIRMPSTLRTGVPPAPGEDPIPLSPAEKITKLESYLLLTAEARGLAEEARLHANSALDLLREQWDALEGWEMYLNGSKNPTGPQIAEAKRKLDPDLFGSIREGESLVKRLGEQIRRLENDDDATSRLYTFITGG